MTTISVRLNEQETKTFEEYAKMNGIPLSTLLKKALEEKMEDEIDMKVIKEYEEKIESNTNEFYSHDQIKEMLGL